MRKIKFRGRDRDGKWYFGNLKVREDDPTWATVAAWIVDPETVGEFTDLQDSEGVDVFEGDIIQNADHLKEIYEVAMIDGAFRILEEGFKGEDLYWTLGHGNFKVIGNIHDNPELLNLS